MSDAETPESPTEESSGEWFGTGDDRFAGSSQPETPRTPFEPESRQKLGGRGCAWMVGVGCGLVLLAGLALVAVLAFNGDRILAWSLGQFETQILADVPESVTEAEQQQLREAFVAARERIRAGEVHPQALQSFQSIMMEMAFKPPGERDSDDYARLQEALDRLASDEAPSPEPEETAPAPEPAAEPAHQEAMTLPVRVADSRRHA